MPSFGIDAQLRLVDRGERKVPLVLVLMVAVAAGNRHAFCGAQEITGCRGDDAFFAGQQCNLLFAFHRDDSVVDLASQQPEGEANDAGTVPAHPLDRQVGLAGIGRSQDRPDRSV